MDYGLIITAILSSAGLFSLIQFLVVRHDNKKNNFTSVMKELREIKDGQKNTDIRITRMELMNLIKEDPDNIDAVLQVAEYYFIELDGNAYAHAIFENLAIEHGVATGWLPKITKGVKNGKRK